jgi:hypothetical protein
VNRVHSNLIRHLMQTLVALVVVRFGVVLRRQGNGLVGCCEFQDGSGASLVVTPGRNLWQCLGATGRGGGRSTR